jgi:pseudolysin
MFFSRYLNLASRFLLCSFFLLGFTPVLAAELKNLRHQPLTVLPSFGFLSASLGVKAQNDLQERSREVDSSQRLHLRLQQTYAGFPVWGAEVRIHLPAKESRLKTASWVYLLTASEKASMNGFVYQGLDADLKQAPALIFEKAQAEEALARAIQLQQQKTKPGSMTMTEKESQLLVYVDKNHKAHWTYFIQFKQEGLSGLPVRPCYLMDAMSFEVYRSWDNIQTQERFPASLAGGYGGNKKMGKLIYDGLNGDYPALPIERDARTQSCYLDNKEVQVIDIRKHRVIEKFTCSSPDANHNNLFWDGSLDAVNGAYSPSNDALFVGKVIQDMYQQWYGTPALMKGGKPMKLIMRVHEDMENAYWDGKQMTFGDGGSFFYPLVSLGVGAHEVSHGFTEQHSNLVYFGQSGGLNESFSDMAAQAAEFYATGKNQWQIGPELMKEEGRALRYMDHPALDCEGLGSEGQCSIEHVKFYNDELDVHYSSGIFNRVFYLLGTAPGWSTKKAFDVMVQANRYYWTPTVNFAEAACGVMAAVKDYSYSSQAAVEAFKAVGLPVSAC